MDGSPKSGVDEISVAFSIRNARNRMFSAVHCTCGENVNGSTCTLGWHLRRSSAELHLLDAVSQSKRVLGGLAVC
jgi:hypothetical protein